IPEWSQEQKEHHILTLNEIYQRGGFIFCVFAKSNLVGIISLDNKFIGRNNDQLNLSGLWISKNYRKLGVGRNPFELVKEKALKIGAKELYVSVTPSPYKVHFHMNRGFELVKEVDKRLYELEPEDIQWYVD
ncbi:MAG: GNAT family N-acetyltransferase, partial [Candidatus Thorarchaeota archaeon]